MTELADLARRYAVATEFVDWRGRSVPVPEHTLVSVLAALGVPAATPAERERAARSHDREYWGDTLAPTVVARSGTAAPFWVHVTHGRPVDVWVELEDGSLRAELRQLENNRAPYDLDGRMIGEATFELPADLPPGYHRLHARTDTIETDTNLIVAPSALAPPRTRQWGLATQLYSVTSEQSWGTGDLTDLTDLAIWSAARHGAGFILVNPLHAAAPVAPMEPSPYLPTSRRFVNPLYLRVEAIDEYAQLRRRGPLRKARAELAARARRRDGIDRDAAWKVKRAALQQVYRVPRSAGRELAYAAFRAREGRSLDDFATWCALAEVHGPDWHTWPQALTHPDNPEVAAFAAANEAAVDFHRWLQWQLDDQLTIAQARATQSGMDLGIMHDLAVGVDPDGADAWALQDVLARGVTAGAPPDEYNQLGQNWSQPPWRPDQLRRTGYAPFRALVNAVLRHAGGVRIDHIIGLFRLWWIPQGAAPTEGTYVRYDHDALIGIVALEAYRSGAVVVGEDLGTVEPWVRDYLRDRGLFGTSILWFERTDEGAPLPAEHWREACLSAVTTHDLPPTAGYLAGEHIRLRESLGLLTRPVEEEIADDRVDQQAWLDELRRLGLVGEQPDIDEIVRGLHAFLGRTPSKLLALALPDAVGDLRAQNQPGTTDEYPNWRVPLSGPDGARMSLEDVFTDRRADALAEVMKAQVPAMDT
ncbi:MAG: 4-alpha-glucanotransferase [Mycolicibacterium neoaurum]|uniref:4-alpha-glucanotransferase n=1 Tax=Mycolicibacterium neoaurum TaxID=1795 RepID=UPI002FF7FFC8